MNTILPIAQIVECTQAEGPGNRFAIWVQGCPLRCPGCCNPEMLPFAGGTATPVDELVAMISRAAGQHALEGLTFLGGEPIAHAHGLAHLAELAHASGLSVMIFSGYTLNEIHSMEDPAVARLIAHTDILVDGRYLQDQPDAARRWIGSRNQQVHLLSQRYDPNDSAWQAPDTLEIRLERDQLTINGFPAPQAVGLWKRPGKPDAGE